MLVPPAADVVREAGKSGKVAGRWKALAAKPRLAAGVVIRGDGGPAQIVLVVAGAEMQQKGRGDGAVIIQALAMRIDAAAEGAGDGLRRTVFAVACLCVGHGAAPEERELVFGAEDLIDLERGSLGVAIDGFRVLVIVDHAGRHCRAARDAERQRNQVLDLQRNRIEAARRNHVVRRTDW